MENKYLQKTNLLNFDAPEIQKVINEHGWRNMDVFHQIKGIYEFVQNDILFGYNEKDDIKATEVLKDGVGQCNTKAILLMALFRALGIPCRFHAFEVDKMLQKGATSAVVTLLAPRRIVHTWVEVYYNKAWIVLEGVIIDKRYLEALKRKFSATEGKFIGYGVATKDFRNHSIDWNGKDVYVQKESIVYEYGIYASPDEFFAQNGQHLGKIKTWIFKNYGRYKMTKNVAKIREND